MHLLRSQASVTKLGNFGPKLEIEKKMKFANLISIL